MRFLNASALQEIKIRIRNEIITDLSEILEKKQIVKKL